MKQITHIECNRWFQRLYGNTYFSSTVFFNDGTQQKIIPFEYGYGEHCLYQTLDKLRELNLYDVPERNKNTGSFGVNPTMFIREVMKASYSINDVNRKKDL